MEELLRWADYITTELRNFYGRADIELADTRLDAFIYNHPQLAAGFTIAPNGYWIEIHSVTGAVSSDATTAIKNGRSGQRIVLHNLSASNVTILNGAKTKLPGAANFVMTPNDILALRWEDSNEEWVALYNSVN